MAAVWYALVDPSAPGQPLLTPVCSSFLDLLHFMFSANLMYTFLISNFGSVNASAQNVWFVMRLKVAIFILTVTVTRSFKVMDSPLIAKTPLTSPARSRL